jgi:predicted phage-related endonuclease
MLSPDQIKAREGKLTASRVACLMTGDAAKIHQLWLEMTGDPSFVPEDLSDVWPVRLGECTEQLNLDWFERTNGVRVERRGEVVVHPLVRWASATLDGFVDDEDGGYVVETKHVGGREPLEIIVERYFPQMSWQLFVAGASQCALSVIMGANAPIVEFIDRDQIYIDEMVLRGAQFMGFVERREPPVVLEAVPPPVDPTKNVDMAESDKSEEWKRFAQQWLQVCGAMQTAKDSEKILKSLVPADAKKAFGNGVRITRDRANRLSLREDAT